MEQSNVNVNEHEAVLSGETEGTVDVQDNLIGGIKIKTINRQSLLGGGNIEIQGGSGDAYTKAETDALLSEKAGVDAVEQIESKVGTLDKDSLKITEQTFTEEEKAQARENIGSQGEDDVKEIIDDNLADNTDIDRLFEQ